MEAAVLHAYSLCSPKLIHLATYNQDLHFSCASQQRPREVNKIAPWSHQRAPDKLHRFHDMLPALSRLSTATNQPFSTAIFPCTLFVLQGMCCKASRMLRTASIPCSSCNSQAETNEHAVRIGFPKRLASISPAYELQLLNAYKTIGHCSAPQVLFPDYYRLFDLLREDTFATV